MAPLASGPDDQLFHVHIRRFQERPLVAHRQHGQRVGLTHSSHAGTLDGIDRDIHRVAVSGTDLLADIEHRRFINFTFADHNLTIDLDLVENVAHGRYGRPISDILVTTSEPLVASQCSRFRHSGKTRLPVHVSSHIQPMELENGRHSTTRANLCAQK